MAGGLFVEIAPAVTTVYVDLDAARQPGTGTARLDEATERSLRLLVDEGHAVLLVAGTSLEPPPPIAISWQVVSEATVSSHAGSPAWYLVGSVDRCPKRSGLLRTILLGSTRGERAVHRCDSEARDVAAAVLEILAVEAMRS